MTTTTTIPAHLDTVQGHRSAAARARLQIRPTTVDNHAEIASNWRALALAEYHDAQAKAVAARLAAP